MEGFKQGLREVRLNLSQIQDKIGSTADKQFYKKALETETKR